MSVPFELRVCRECCSMDMDLGMRYMLMKTWGSLMILVFHLLFASHAFLSFSVLCKLGTQNQTFSCSFIPGFVAHFRS